jgi:hypothetical protein
VILVALLLVMPVLPISTGVEGGGLEFRMSLGGAHASFLGDFLYDGSGSSVAGVGDVNGDGYADFVIGTPGRSVIGTDSGTAYLVFGGPDGWGMRSGMGIASVALRGNYTDQFVGRTVAAAGDVNGDGYDDILIGSNGGGSQWTMGWNGRTFLVLGKPTGWAREISLPGEADASFEGVEAYENSGWSVAGVGDVNGDGLDDMLIGAPWNDEAGTDAGQAYLVLGDRSGWGLDVPLTDVAAASFWGEHADDRAGWSVAGAGDVNRDGFDDLLIGAIQNDEVGVDAGQAYLVLGKATGWAADTPLSASSASFRGEAALDRAGASVAGAGDVDGDGYDDLLVGAPDNGDGGAGAGQTYLVLGRASGWAMDAPLGASSASFWGEGAGDASGTSVASAGDVDADGLDDLLVGAPGGSRAGAGAGEAYVVLGRTTGWAMDTVLTTADASYTGEAAGDNAGQAVAGAGDVNGDGHPDILVGAPGSDGQAADTGQTYLVMPFALPPAPRGVKATATPDGRSVLVTWRHAGYWNVPIVGYRLLRSTRGGGGGGGGDPDVIARLPPSTLSYLDQDVVLGGSYCYALVSVDAEGRLSQRGPAAGIDAERDTDGDGTPDMLDPDRDGDLVPDLYDLDPGTVDPVGWTMGRALRVNVSGFGTRLDGERADDAAGYFMADAGDVNGDGYADFLVGASENDNHGNGSGMIHLFLGRPGGWPPELSLAEASASFYGIGHNSGVCIGRGGDANGDGYDDIIIGSCYDGTNGQYAGAVYVVFGRPSGWARDMPLVSTADASYVGEHPWDLAGYCVDGSGDVNGDGYDDLVISAVTNHEVSNSSGEVYLVLGKPSGWTLLTNLSQADASWRGERWGAYGGSYVASGGDVNGDGYDDFVVSAQQDSGLGNFAGKVYLILGRESGWGSDVNLSGADAVIEGKANDWLGGRLAIDGDVNGDGLSDIMMSTWLDIQNRRVHSGTVYMFLGRTTGWGDHMPLTSADAWFNGEATEDSFSFPFYLGDINDDGLTDFALMAPASSYGAPVSGLASLFYGRASGFGRNTSVSTADVNLYGDEKNACLGITASRAGDIDGDGCDEFLIGSICSWNLTVPGRAYLFDRTQMGGAGLGQGGKGVAGAVKDLAATLSTGDTTGVELAWADTAGPAGMYGIYRGFDAHSFYRLANTTEATYTDASVAPGRTYYYAVVEVDPLGGEGPFPTPVSIVADADTDGDGVGNLMDTDDDGDGVVDGQDAFPLDPAEWLDTDSDGTGNEADPDDDNDGLLDAQDAEPLNPLNVVVDGMDLLNATLQDLQADLAGVWRDLLSMSGNLTGLRVEVGDLGLTLEAMLDALSVDLADLALQVKQANASLQTKLGSMDARMTTYYTATMNEISNLNLKVQTESSKLAARMDGVNATMRAGIDSLRTDIASLKTELTADLMDIMTALAALDTDMTAQVFALNRTLGELETLTLDQLLARLAEVEGAVTTGDQALSDLGRSIQWMIDDVNATVGAFRSQTSLTLLNLSEQMRKLDTIRTDVGDLRSHTDERIDGVDEEVAQIDAIVTDMTALRKEQSDTKDRVRAVSRLSLIILLMTALAVVIMVVVFMMQFEGWKKRHGPDQEHGREPRLEAVEGPRDRR